MINVESLKIELETIFGKLFEIAFIGSKLVVVDLSQIMYKQHGHIREFIFKVGRCNVLEDVLFGALSFT
jgi:hypothetical protein